MKMNLVDRIGDKQLFAFTLPFTFTCALFLCVLCVLMMVGCDDASSGTSPSSNASESGFETSTETKTIATTNYALKEITAIIAGDGFEVWQPTFEGAVPTREQLKQLQRSDVVFTNGPGADFAPWLALVSLDANKICETTTHSFELSDFIQVAEHQIVHSHGDEGTHSHPWMVPHCWLDPRLVLLQGEVVRDRLIAIYPDAQQTFRENFDAHLKAPLSAMIESNQKLAETIKGRAGQWVTSDPRLKFFTKSLGVIDTHLLWFELPAPSAALKQIKEKMPTENAAEKVWLLWAQDGGKTQQMLDEKLDALRSTNMDLIEHALPDLSLIDRLRLNYERISALGQ